MVSLPTICNILLGLCAYGGHLKNKNTKDNGKRQKWLRGKNGKNKRTPVSTGGGHMVVSTSACMHDTEIFFSLLVSCTK